MKWSSILDTDTLKLGSDLANRALEERELGKSICPPQELIFKALELTPPDKTKVCIVGQDPYHTPGVANGLAFSAPTIKQPSLTNIFKELSTDLGINPPSSGDLTPWAKRGVLLLNTSLTVYAHQPNSHSKWGWRDFAKGVLKVAHSLPQPVVFIFWGANAQSLLNSLITSPSVYHDHNKIVTENLVKKAYILSSHPSPFSASKKCGDTPPFIGSKPFSTANNLLIKMGGEPIDWSF